MLANPEDVKCRWKEYFEELLNRPDPLDPVDDMNAEDVEVEDLQEDEVKKAVKGLKNCKAGGIDGIVGELVRYGGENLMNKLIGIYKRVWEDEEMPDEWNMGIYVPLHKKEDRSSCENYRGLCLLSIGECSYI